MNQVITNRWIRRGGLEVATILQHDQHPEVLDFERVRFQEQDEYRLARDQGSLLTVIAGTLKANISGYNELSLCVGTHMYLPPQSGAVFKGGKGTELVAVQAPTQSRARGTKLLLRDDQFLAACSLPDSPLRWILTPQYLSRRVFLHHDRTLVSPIGHPVSWFHTTMFDVAGLPLNDEGVPVFKMSYNFRTEPNVCYEVSGKARVRMAHHPYTDDDQRWQEWQTIDSQTTYHLNEDAKMAEWRQAEGIARPLRNKHEVHIADGHVSLLCMHDPAPTGAERHSAGQYSEYGDLANTLGTPEYKAYLGQLKPFEAMVDALSMAKAEGHSDLTSLPEWSLYQQGLAAQRAVEGRMRDELVREGAGRERILEPWMLRLLG
jgi:hypothetical protein